MVWYWYMSQHLQYSFFILGLSLLKHYALFLKSKSAHESSFFWQIDTEMILECKQIQYNKQKINIHDLHSRFIYQLQQQVNT